MANSEQTVLITGGAGFIGSHVARHFVRRGYRVVIADRFTYAGRGRNLQDLWPHIELLVGDLATGDLAERCANVHADYVIHMAANTHVDRAIGDPEGFMVSNVVGTTRLLEALSLEDRWGRGFLTKVIVYSTDEVFGATPVGEQFDEAAPFNPSNAYSASKVGVEAITNAFFVTHKLPVVIVRPCNTYGPGQDAEKVIPKFVHQLLAGQDLTVYNDGQGARDWLHVEDHARAIEVLCKAAKPGQSFNLAANDEHTDMEIAVRIAELVTGKPHGIDPSLLPIRFVPGRPGHDRRYWMKGDNIRALGWFPVVPFDQGFAETVRWAMAHADHGQSDLVKVA
jgi:dTDP-glucose 4,6-dehydratase